MSQSKPQRGRSEADIWRDFVQAEIKIKSKLGTLLEPAVYGGYENKNLTIYFADDDQRKKAQGQLQAIKDKLQQHRLYCDRIYFKTGSVPNNPPRVVVANNRIKSQNPLQALYWIEPSLPSEGDEAQRMNILNATVEAEKFCASIYRQLQQRTLDLAGDQANTIRVSFNWRLRVGGTRGFRELLLPVLHPIFGIPYIPASTLKGAARAWARNNDTSPRVKELLGMMEGNNVKAAKVEFLDAFPTKPCLSIDVATPQWSWNGDKVTYQPIPHPLLSLYQPEFLIGLRSTTRGGQDKDSVQVVKQWLENALADGIGSRVSGGYGRSLNAIANDNRRNYDLELWTQGMYGSDPPSKENGYQGSAEFRPTAVRGILRYWFRAIALALYDVETCRTLEDTLFGKLGQQGKISINTKINPPSKKDPYLYTGKIYLEATSDKYLDLAEQLLILASHLGGVGRGSRRPLHLLDIDGRRVMRGCHWEVFTKETLTYDEKQWRTFFTKLQQIFANVQAPISSYISDPGRPNQRQQDVLDRNAQVWLVKSPGQISPDRVNNWQAEGDRSNVRGAALNLFYGDKRFKGSGKTEKGNSFVGGALGTPSFVWIKSIFIGKDSSYQVVTIFGCNNSDRRVFFQELDKLRKQNQAILVFGEIDGNNRVIRPMRR